MWYDEARAKITIHYWIRGARPRKYDDRSRSDRQLVAHGDSAAVGGVIAVYLHLAT